ncbi:MAG TPA: 16S rRNA (cytosine(967)-C(5))-methyltransferase RsmB [Candidatus Latescibacteria bacterium]|nr:16S rRNA (cytosine(967)-C(5))-methyltransferase RsmB [Candidatus Latescibacterota bacterium]
MSAYTTLTAREIALRFLRRVEDGAYADKLLDGISSANLIQKDKGFVRELVLGTTRWRGRIDWVLRKFVHKDLEDLTAWIRNILRLGAYQILFLDRVPPWAVVNESVNLATKYGHPGTAGLVNAVLRTLVREKGNISYPDRDRDPVAYLSVFYSHPEWMVERWIKRWGFEETAQLCKANNLSPKVSIRTNSLKTTPERLMKELSKAGIVAQPNKLVSNFLDLECAEGLFETTAFADGWLQVQDPSAGLVSILLDPHPGERILDVCSAPGGKATHVAELMRNIGLIVALDKQKGRLRMLQENSGRLGISIIHAEAQDALRYAAQPFDRVLVDVPCSGLGVLARRADARWKAEETIDQLTQLQSALLKKGAELTRAGGVIVYSTCSIEPQENEMIIEAFLMRNSAFELEKASEFLSSEVADSFVRTFPHKHGCDGSFAARLRKRSD